MAKAMSSTVLQTSVANVAGTTTRTAAFDCTPYDGGEVRWRITNGGTGPTVACEARVLVARKQGSLPAAAAEGTGDDAWKIRVAQSGGTTNNASTRGAFRFGPEIAYLHMEFTGNTVQDVTVEAVVDVFSY